MSAAREVDVEQQLRLAAATAAWPATPDLRAGVLARIAAGDAAPAGSVVAAPVPDRRPAWLRPLAAVALALLALLAVVGVAAGLGFRLPGFDIVIVERLPSAAAVPGSIAPTGSRSAGAPPTAGAQRNLGSPIPVSDAVVLDRPRVLVPTSMPTPDAAYVIGAGDRRIVTLAWRAEPGQARLPSSDLALTVMAVPGDIDDSLIKKIATPDTSVALVSVERRPGLVDLGGAARAADRATRRPGRVDPRRDRGRHPGVRARRDALPAGVVPRAGRDRRHRRRPALNRSPSAGRMLGGGSGRHARPGDDP